MFKRSARLEGVQIVVCFKIQSFLDFPNGTVDKNSLPMQGTWVWSVIQEGRFHVPWATKPMCHNYWACALGPGSRNYRICATATEACAPYSLCSTTGSHCNAKPAHRSWGAAPARCNQRQARRAIQPQHCQKQMIQLFKNSKAWSWK